MGSYNLFCVDNKLETVQLIRGGGQTIAIVVRVRKLSDASQPTLSAFERRLKSDRMAYATGEVRTHAAVTTNGVRAPRAPRAPHRTPRPPVTSQSMPYIALII